MLTVHSRAVLTHSDTPTLSKNSGALDGGPGVFQSYQIYEMPISPSIEEITISPCSVLLLSIEK